MDDIRTHIRALLARREIGVQLAGRPDIFQLTESLMALQDGYVTDNGAALASSQGSMPSADELAGGLIRGTEFDPSIGGIGLAVPAGVRHALLHFSPILQLAALASPDRRVGGAVIQELPSSKPTLLAWLAKTIAMPGGVALADRVDEKMLGQLAEKQEQEAVAIATAIEQRAAFAKRFGFTLSAYADFLLALRQRDPIAYVLILSREFGLARQRCPELAYKARIGHPLYIPRFGRSPLTVAMALAEMQRAAAITRALYRMGGRTGTGVIRRMMPGGDTDHDPNEIDDEVRMEAIAAIVIGTGAGSVLDEAPLHAAGIRRLFRMSKQDRLAIDVNNVIASLLDGRLDWNSAASVETHGGWRHHVRSQVDANIHRHRGGGRGEKAFDEPLDLFCGITPGMIPALAISSIGEELTGKQSPRETEYLSAAMTSQVAGSPMDSGSYGLKLARRRRAGYLPREGRQGSAGRFTPRLWLDRYQDEVLFRRLAQPVDITAVRWINRSKPRRMLLIALWFLQVCFVRLYRKSGASTGEVEIMCDLATGVTVLTSDPILWQNSKMLRRMAEESESLSGKRRKSNFAAVHRVLVDGSPAKAVDLKSPWQTNL